MGYIYGFDGGGFTGIYLTQTHQVVYIKYVQLFTYESYLNQVVRKLEIQPHEYTS